LSTALAVTEAKRLDEIKFPAFTAKLITDTFDALIAAHLKQTESYSELLKAVSQDLTTYINNTEDEISGDMILHFLTKIVEKPQDLNKEDYKIEGEDLKKIQAAVGDVKTQKTTTDKDGNTTTNTGPLIPLADDADKQAILQAVAKRIAVDKYNLLKEMIKMGLLRLVVESGVIETKLTFKTFASDFYTNNSTYSNTTDHKAKAEAKTGSWFTRWLSASASTDYSSVSVSTANSTTTSKSESSVEIFGRVQINFKTDYQALSTTT